MTKKAYFNRCPDCGEVRIDHLELDGEKITCLTCGHVYSLSFYPQPSGVFPREAYEQMKPKAETDQNLTGPDSAGGSQ